MEKDNYFSNIFVQIFYSKEDLYSRKMVTTIQSPQVY